MYKIKRFMHTVPHMRETLALTARHRARTRDDSPRILALRHFFHQNRFPCHNHFLNWVWQNAPDAAAHFQLGLLPMTRLRWDEVALFTPWLQDPVTDDMPAHYRRAKEIEDECIARGIPVVNGVSTFCNSVKSTALSLLREAGIKAARSVPIHDIAEFRQTMGGLTPPFIIREDFKHRSGSVLIETPDALEHVPWRTFSKPVAIEFIDTLGSDGLYRKYRCMMIGDRALPRHMIPSRNWNVHAGDRKSTPRTNDEEISYMSGSDPNCAALDRARKVLGFDIVAFDYSYDREGNLVIWEPNPSPIIWTRSVEESPLANHHTAAIARIYAAILSLYLNRAGLGGSDIKSS